MTNYLVAGEFPIVDATTGESVLPGGTVELVDARDGGITNTDALLAGGLIAPLPAKSEKKTEGA